MNRLNKNRGKENNTKGSGLIVQGMVKNQLETVEVEKASFSNQKFSLNFVITVEFPRKTQQKQLASTTIQNRGTG